MRNISLATDSVQQGRCLCGHYIFHVSTAPLWVAYCHCESCRRFTAAPTTTYVGFEAEQVHFAPHTPPTFASSAEVRRSFCPHCSTPLAYAADWFPGEIHLFRSNFAEPERFKPTRHVLFNEREADFDIYDDLPRYGTRPGNIIGWGAQPALRVLFVSRQNALRSILAEAMLNLSETNLKGRRVRGHSAGYEPAGTVDARVLAFLERAAYQLDHLRSKSWQEFASEGTSGLPLDWLITLDGESADTADMALPGRYQRRHWDLPEPQRSARGIEAIWMLLEQHVTVFLEELRQLY